MVKECQMSVGYRRDRDVSPVIGQVSLDDV